MFRPRFKIRSLLIATFAAACVFGIKSHEARQQQWAVEMFEKRGADITYSEPGLSESWAPLRWCRERLGRHYFDDVTGVTPWIDHDLVPAAATLRQLEELSFTKDVVDADLAQFAFHHRVRFLDLTNAQITDDGLRRMWTYGPPEGLEELELTGTNIGDETLARVAHRNLRWLSLSETCVSDRGLKYLAGMDQLEVLMLDHTCVRGAGLHYVAPLPALDGLFLDGLPLGDDAMAVIAQIRSITELTVADTHISDAGIEHLRALRSLESICICGTDVSRRGLLRLADLPNLTEVIVGDGHERPGRITQQSVDEFFRLRPDCVVDFNKGGIHFIKD